MTTLLDPLALYIIRLVLFFGPFSAVFGNDTLLDRFGFFQREIILFYSC